MTSRPHKNLKISTLKRLSRELRDKIRSEQELLDTYHAEITLRYKPKEIKSHA